MLPVLIFEPHNELRNVIAQVLERAHVGFQVVGTPTDALLKLRGGNYSHIVIDVDSGLDTAKLYETLTNDPSLMAKVIVISDRDETLPEAMSHQPTLLKPFDTDQLLAPLKD